MNAQTSDKLTISALKITIVFLLGSWLAMFAIVLLLGGLHLAEELVHEGWLSIGVGLVAQAIVASLLPSLVWHRKSSKAKALGKGALAWASVFLAGVFVGGLINIIAAHYQNSHSDSFPNLWAKDFRDYFLTPAAWLSIIGLPCALIIGAAYGVIVSSYQSNSKD